MNGKLKSAIATAFLSLGVAIPLTAEAFDLQLVDPSTNTPVTTGFRYLVEEDITHDPAPGFHIDPNTLIGVSDADLTTTKQFNDPPLAIDLHRSHATVVESGEVPSGTPIATINVPDGRYHVSVLPFENGATGGNVFDMGGTIVTVENGVVTQVAGVPADGTNVVTVKVRSNPIQTAQISIQVFEDNNPLDNAPSIGEGAPADVTQFTVELSDQAGPIVQDAFGNPLGTTYQEDANGNPILDANGDPIIQTLGSNVLHPDANGFLIVKNLRPGKYGIVVKPPSGSTWQQVTTIEGTPTIDAWVRPKEPPFLVEFGPPITHVFYGFIQPTDRLSDPTLFPPGPVTTVTGRIVQSHLSHPPAIQSFLGGPLGTSNCWIGLNTVNAANAIGEAVYAQECDPDGTFTIPNVPDGTFQLVIWDKFLDQIISFQTIIVQGGTLDLGKIDPTKSIAVPMWFATQEHSVFTDSNANGIRDPGETGIPDMPINLRFRDGTIYQAIPTDANGNSPFEEIFPFFHWQVAEVGFGKLKATGVSIVVDDGGPVTNDQYGEGKRNPQIQDPADPANDANIPQMRVETGPVLLEAFQSFAGQNTRLEWGKKPYNAGENGGISGIVFYATTRAENDPQLAAGEPWEPGIPRVQVNLYEDKLDNTTGLPAFLGDGIPDPQDPAATFPYLNWVKADVDNVPLGDFPGPGDVDHNLNGVFDLGDAIATTHTDSWDDNLPTGCRANDPVTATVTVHGVDIGPDRCADGLRNWNQVRPGVFDGGYAFGDNVAQDGLNLTPGPYIVEVPTPPGYKLVKEEDKNVDFGTIPVPALLPPECVGDPHTVPPYLSFQTDSAGNLVGDLANNPTDAVAAPFAGQTRPLCDRKKVFLQDKQNAAADFFLFTDVPRAGHIVGIITDDLATETAPGKPNFTEKFVVGWLPIAIFDYTGKEIVRTYSGEFGNYNALIPSSYDINLPTPSGVGPKMHQLCLNHPGPIPDGQGGFVTDPFFRPQYSTTCYTFNFEPGRTTYLDTPVIRTAAFVGPLQSTLDCELPAGTPLIQQVIANPGDGAGPVLTGARTSLAGKSFTLISAGLVDVPNPAFPGTDAQGFPADPPNQPRFVQRDFGFGANAGQVCVKPDNTAKAEYCFPSTNVLWSDGSIGVTIPATAVDGNDANGELYTGQLTVVKADGTRSKVGITLTAGGIGNFGVREVPNEYPTIQAAVDAAAPGNIVVVHPGVYSELVVVTKPIQIQGTGAATILDAKHFSAANVSPLEQWNLKVETLAGLGEIGFVGNQETIADPANQIPFFADGQGPGIFVAPVEGLFDSGRVPRIDGFTIRSADLGGAIYANAHANRLRISNMRLLNNAGNFGGGIRIGNPLNPGAAAVGTATIPADVNDNPNVRIHHNQIVSNGSLSGGGGIFLGDDSDSYQVTDNWICGNLARDGGGGIKQQGLAENDAAQTGGAPGVGLIADNTIIFNETFQALLLGVGGGGGIEIAGELDPAGGLTLGTGDVTIDGNLIQGNLAGASDGGGISLLRINGQDVANNQADPTQWHTVRVYNNMIVNNVSGLAGAGIAMKDAARAFIIHNTVAHNDSSATAAGAFGVGGRSFSDPQPAGIVARAHSAGLAAVSGQTFSEPTQLRKNIVWENRSFFWCDAVNAAGNTACQRVGLNPDPATGPYVYDDFGVLGTTGQLNPIQSFVSDATGLDPSNLSGDPLLVSPYFNDLKSNSAADEGGNFVQVTYTPLGLTGDYHLTATSPAINAAGSGFVGGRLATDFDGEPRPSPESTKTDMGADEVQNPGAVNTPPTVVISSPIDGLAVPPGTVVTFEALANDTEDGDLSNSVQWSVDGVNVAPVGNTIDLSLPDGTHVIAATVTDSGGLNGSDQVSVTWIVNTAPTVTINQPLDPTTVGVGTVVNFAALADDPEQGDISDQIVWTEGTTTLVTGASFGASLPLGTHVITATVTDAGGLTGSDTVTVNVINNTLPVVTITAPADGSQFNLGDSITFAGTASDNEDGDITQSLIWRSNIDGVIGSGPGFTTTLSGGVHTITADVTDSLGGAGSASIQVTVLTVLPPDTLTCKKAVYKAAKDQLQLEVKSSDNTGTLTVTATVSGTGLGTVTLPPKQVPGNTYKTTIQPVPNDDPTSASVVTATSSLGGTCTMNVKVD